jgi:hypothetical protein
MDPGNMVELDRRLADLVQSAGGDYPVADIREEMVTTSREIRADDTAHGLQARYFFSFSAWRGVAVFTVYANGLEIYVIPYEPEQEWDLIRKFEPLAMMDVDESRDILRRDYGKSAPDLSVEPTLASEWLGRT